MNPKINQVWLILLLIALTSQNLYAQTKISGTVKDVNGLGLPGVSVLQENTQNGTMTDQQGKYNLVLKEGSKPILHFNYIGYLKQTIAFTGSTTIDVILKENQESLNEVVVLGYNTQKKSDLSGAVTNVRMSELEDRRVADVAQVLQGQVAGVQITQSTGAPGEPINIRIRGEGTFGDNSPLFIVDGIPSRDISFLNPSDMQSITVLKDASAAAMYGARASAGVVVITTKIGAAGKSSIDINYFNGIQKVSRLPKMLNTTQYMNKMEESWNNSGYSGTNPYTADKGRTDFANTNWLDELFETGRSQNLQLTASGGSEKTKYLLSAAYYGQDGIVVYKNDKYQRFTFRTNITSNLSDRFTVGSNLQLSYAKQDKLSSKGDAPGIIRHAFIRPPVIPVYKNPNDPTWSAEDPFTDLPFYKNSDQANGGYQSNKYEYSSNPVALAYFTNDKRYIFKTFGNVYGEYALLRNKELKFRTNIGVDLNFTHNKAFNQNFGDDDGGGDLPDKGLGRKNRPNSLNEDRGQESTITWNNTLNYNKTIGKHAITAMVGSEYITNHSSGVGGSRIRFEYTQPEFQYLDYGNDQTKLWNSGSGAEWTLFSLFGTATYVYDSKYMITANMRADASSRFGPNNKWGYFPSVSAGWKISQEAFMKDIHWISDLKLRLSTGKLGNQEIGNYTYLTLYTKDANGIRLLRYGNPDLQWETTTQNNIGLDIGLLQNKLYFTADYFKKKTTGVLLPLSLPRFVGDVQPTTVNAGEVSNSGLEISASYRNNERAFKYSISGNIGTLKNVVNKLHPNLPNLTGQVTRTEAGHPLNAFYGYVMDGIYQNQQEIDRHLYGTPGHTEKPGDIKFKDLNGDGVINDKDRDYLGNPNPRFSYGLNLSASYKGFDFSALFQGVQGVEKYNDLKKIIDYDTRPFNHSVNTLNSWHGEGTSNTVPRSTFTDNGSSRISSIFVENASYLRLKNVEIGYSLKSLLAKSKLGLQNVRLYLSGQNLFTVTKYTGLDPESTDLLDMGTYPQSRAFLFGINVKF
ncbi:SusC/RagA family TonB-linked outer membrane protein [Pedobacter nutrimenti]|uniref:TonB-linked SusC/RagA family outer membrane protein n=1 Tax=Pedobacter nutrimenti TaxID=1241337 RepID=A0A318UAK0_9SPHI|nr:TonB-dependent receptor [Pedobacter nutrimenti]PYF70042.1 TonB-linked SusC/RagA family outer membrane protein [Pedobacter nutrimenti]